MNCPHCQAELPENDAAQSCPACGRILPPIIESKAPDAVPKDNSLCWMTFWAAFFSFPIICLLGLYAGGNPVFLFLVLIGAIIAGFSLAKIYAKTPTSFVVMGILYTLGVLAIYLGILFVGCLVVAGVHGVL